MFKNLVYKLTEVFSIDTIHYCNFKFLSFALLTQREQIQVLRLLQEACLAKKILKMSIFKGQSIQILFLG